MKILSLLVETIMSPTPVVPVPVTFSLPLSLLVAWLVQAAGILVALGLMWKFISKLSEAISFLRTLRPRIRRIERSLKKLKTHAGIDDGEDLDLDGDDEK